MAALTVRTQPQRLSPEMQMSDKLKVWDLTLPYLGPERCLVSRVSKAAHAAASAPLYRAQEACDRLSHVTLKAKRIIDTLSPEDDTRYRIGLRKIEGPYKGKTPEAYFQAVYELANDVNLYFLSFQFPSNGHGHFPRRNIQSLMENLMVLAQKQHQPQKGEFPAQAHRQLFEDIAFRSPYSSQAITLANELHQMVFKTLDDWKKMKQLEDLTSSETFREMTQPLRSSEVVTSLASPALCITAICYRFYQIHPVLFTLTVVGGGILGLARSIPYSETAASEEETNKKIVLDMVLNQRMLSVRQRVVNFACYAVPLAGLSYGASYLNQGLVSLPRGTYVSGAVRGLLGSVFGFCTGISIGVAVPVNTISGCCQRVTQRFISIFRCGRNRPHVD